MRSLKALRVVRIAVSQITQSLLFDAEKWTYLCVHADKEECICSRM